MKKIILVFALVLMTSPAYALIIDLPDVDGLGYFKDTSTGYTWFDVDNFSEVRTKDDYMTQLFETEFHLANLSELLELQQSIPLGPESFDFHFDVVGGVSYSILGGAALLCNQNSEGVITCQEPPEPRKVITGFYDDGGGLEGLSISSWHPTGDQWWFDEFNYSPDGFLFGSGSGSPPRGAFVVNSQREPVVPEPATILLFSSGLLGTMFYRRKRS